MEATNAVRVYGMGIDGSYSDDELKLSAPPAFTQSRTMAPQPAWWHLTKLKSERPYLYIRCVSRQKGHTRGLMQFYGS